MEGINEYDSCNDYCYSRRRYRDNCNRSYNCNDNSYNGCYNGYNSYNGYNGYNGYSGYNGYGGYGGYNGYNGYNGY